MPTKVLSIQPAEASAPASVALQPQELVAAVAPALSQPVASAPPSRRSSLLSSIPGLPAQPSRWTFPGLKLHAVVSRTPRSQLPRSRPEAAASQAPSEAGVVDESRKRASDVPVERPQDAEGNPPLKHQANSHETLKVSTVSESLNDYEHPLKQIVRLAEQDKNQPLDHAPDDHGSWDGRWPLPSRSEWMAHEHYGIPWPSGSAEVNAVQTARKEYKWA